MMSINKRKITDQEREHIARLLRGSTHKALATRVGVAHSTISKGLQQDAFAPELLKTLLQLRPEQLERRKPKIKPKASQNPFFYARKIKTQPKEETK